MENAVKNSVYKLKEMKNGSRGALFSSIKINHVVMAQIYQSIANYMI